MSLSLSNSPAVIEVDVEDGVQRFEVSAEQLEVDTVVHDPDRQMGAEYCHILTADVDGLELQWLVYEYPEGTINHVDSPSNVQILKDFSFDYDWRSEDDDLPFDH